MYKHLEQLVNNYENRKGIKIEKEVFKILNAYEDECERSYSYKTIESFKRYFKIKELFMRLDKNLIDNNIYLKCCDKYLKSSINDCTNIMLEVVLNDSYINNENSFSVESKTAKDYLFQKEDLKDKKVKTISENLDKMYCEIYRLQLCNMSSIIPNNGIDVYNCLIKREDNDVIFTANFLGNSINDYNYKSYKLTKEENKKD